MIGIVTIHDGPALPDGEIIAPTVANDPKDPNFHNNFRIRRSFSTLAVIAAGSCRCSPTAATF